MNSRVPTWGYSCHAPALLQTRIRSVVLLKRDFSNKDGIQYGACDGKTLEKEKVLSLLWHLQMVTHSGGSDDHVGMAVPSNWPSLFWRRT